MLEKLEFTKSWTNKDDFPTYEESEEQVRQDMQCLHDEARVALNKLVDALAEPEAAAQVGAATPAGMQGSTVQALIEELAAAIGALGGSVEIDGEALQSIVTAQLGQEILGNYYTAAETEQCIGDLGVTALRGRVESLESLFAEEGIILGEVEQEHRFVLPGSELAGAALMMSTQRTNRLFAGNTLAALVGGTSDMLLKKLNVVTGETASITLSGQAPTLSSNSQAYTLCWADTAGRYMIIKVNSVWYLVSLGSGICSQLVSGSEYTFCGAALTGNIVVAVFYCSNRLYFQRRDISADSGETAEITALDTYYESGSLQDRMINACGASVFAIMKYYISDSRIKLYNPANMSCSAEFSTGMPGAYPVNSIRRHGADAYFVLLDTNGNYYYARCALNVTDGVAAPTLIIGAAAQSSSRIIAAENGVVYAVAGEQLYMLSEETLELRSSCELPDTLSSYLCAMDGAELGGLWGGKYIPAGSWLLDVTDMSSRALRCDGDEPDDYPVQPSAQRCFVVHANSRWYLFDSTLRPIWGKVSCNSAGQEPAEELPVVDASAFGSMTKA